MKKPKQKTSQQKITTASLVIASVSLFMSLILGVLYLEEVAVSNLRFKSSGQNYFDNYYDISRLRFCYENSIKPCSDDAITSWNATHDETFSLTRIKVDF